MGERVYLAFQAEYEGSIPFTRSKALKRLVDRPGRILNRRTAHGQYMGGTIWGVGSVIHEQTEIDPRTSRYVNSNRV
jgi:xanthine dehydrogenase YagR molybdenum-binding subunit